MKSRLSFVFSLVVLGGCINAHNTQLPRLGFGDPRAEREALAHHDPLPERESGPAMNSRPPGFLLNRTEPRRVIEQTTPRTISEPAVAPQPTPASASKYPHTVAP